MSEAEIINGDREGDGNIRVGLDPFVQPPILKAFFEVLPLEELAKCRLVSKLWYEESLSTWRSRCNTTLKLGREGIVSTADDGSRHVTSLGEFLDLWDAGDWGSCPVFKQFGLRKWNFKPEHVDQQRFLELVGGHITSLTLEECSFVGLDHFRRIIYQAFPKLQFLKMDQCKVDDVIYRHASAGEIVVYKEPAFGVHGLKSLDISARLPDSMMDMLSHFHKLRSLRLEPEGTIKSWNLELEDGYEVLEDYPTLLETIRLIRAQDQAKLPLKNFDVELFFGFGADTASSMARLKLLEQLKLPLQRLEIYFDLGEDKEMDRNLDVFRDILQYHSSTLKSLKFGRNNVLELELCKSFPFGFNLANLEELVIPPRFSGNLNFLRYTPNLRVLDMMGGGLSLSLSETDNLFSSSAQLEIGDWALPSLTELKIDLPRLSVCDLGKLMKWMPNLERLWWISLDNVKFAMICNKWKNLKYLEDYGGELTDEGVLGIGNGLPNITQLKSLTIFTTLSNQLTSASVHDGFLKLAKLKWLSLGDLTEIDEEARAALETRNIHFYY